MLYLYAKHTYGKKLFLLECVFHIFLSFYDKLFQKFHFSMNKIFVQVLEKKKTCSKIIHLSLPFPGFSYSLASLPDIYQVIYFFIFWFSFSREALVGSLSLSCCTYLMHCRNACFAWQEMNLARKFEMLIRDCIIVRDLQTKPQVPWLSLP